MNFKLADKLVRALNIICFIAIAVFLITRDYQPTLSWSGLAVAIAASVVCFILSWKFRRCPYCDHVISTFRKSDECSVCNKKLVTDIDGNLMKLETYVPPVGIKYQMNRNNGGKKKGKKKKK